MSICRPGAWPIDCELSSTDISAAKTGSRRWSVLRLKANQALGDEAFLGGRRGYRSSTGTKLVPPTGSAWRGAVARLPTRPARKAPIEHDRTPHRQRHRIENTANGA